MFCNHCRSKVGAGANFCPFCGNAISNATSSSDALGNDEDEIVQSAVSLRVKELTRWVWASVLACAVGSFLGWSDVRCYYDCGRTAQIVVDAMDIILSIWLAYSFMKRKRWACIAVAISGIALPFLLLWGTTWDTWDCEFYDVLAILEAVGFAYCAVIILIKKDVRKWFSEKGNGWILYWSATLIMVIAMYVYVVWAQRYGNEAWRKDCLNAAIAGSRSAREDFISVLASEYIAEDDSLSYEECEEMAKKEVKNILVQNGISDEDLEKEREKRIKKFGARMLQALSRGKL